MTIRQRWDDDPVDNGYKLYAESESAAEELDIAQFEVNELRARLALAEAALEAEMAWGQARRDLIHWQRVDTRNEGVLAVNTAKAKWDAAKAEWRKAWRAGREK
jgi:hypothetical protein